IRGSSRISSSDENSGLETSPLAGSEFSWPDVAMNAARSPQPEDVLGFWFSNHAMARWFSSDEAVDAEIENLFEPLVEGAVKGALDCWTGTPEGALALVILLDQFPRNLFRGQPKAFAFDNRAREISCEAIANGFDLDIPRERRLFFYLPFMHSED